MGLISTSTNIIPSRRRKAQKPPNLDGVDRRFQTRTGDTLIDSIASRDGTVLFPWDSVVITSVIEFTDLTGVTIVSYSGDQILSKSGNTIVSSGTGNVFDLLLSDGTFIPFLHLGWDVSGNDNHAITITDIVVDYSINGSRWFIENGATLRSGNYIPHDSLGRFITTPVVGDVEIAGVGANGFLNATPFLLDFNNVTPVDPEYEFFDRSVVSRWGTLTIYQSDNFIWPWSELTQQWIYDNVQDNAEKYKWWIKLYDNGMYKDLFFYSTALTGTAICAAKEYVKLGEDLDAPEEALIPCDIDYTDE